MSRQLCAAPLLLLLAVVPGCLQVRTTEHRITLNKDGGGEHRLRMIDIRSDGATDSAVAYDYRVMMSSFDAGVTKEFDKQGRTVIDKKLYTRGDTLIAELTYSFKDLAAAEGLRVREDEFFVVVPPEREIIRCNGEIEEQKGGGSRIVWDRDAARLVYVLRDKVYPSGRSLAPYYRGEKK